MSDVKCSMCGACAAVFVRKRSKATLMPACLTCLDIIMTLEQLLLDTIDQIQIADGFAEWILQNKIVAIIKVMES